MRFPDPTDDVVRRRMQSQARDGTKPELLLRRELHRRGLRFRVDTKIDGLARKRPDIVFTRRRVAIFVDGCFWHSCPEHGTLPKSNAQWWAEKLKSNVDRDRSTNEQLSALGWTVIRVWEHENVADAADRIERVTRTQL